MANTDRRYLDNSGNQFMPMNVEGGSWDEHFISTKKLVFLGMIIFSFVFIMVYASDKGMSIAGRLVYIAIWFLVSQWVLRFVIFEEKFYYKMYKAMKQYETTTPAVFWDIASIHDSPDGAILTYSDTKIGILIKLERDTVTGKHPDFKEIHYDAISDFYRELMSYKYQFVQINVMEQAGNDPRLEKLDQLVNKSDNNNICKLMERMIGYIKNMSHNTLYESDYILVYTTDLSRVDSIINDSIDCVYKILDGAYIGYRILSSREIIEFVKEEYGVKYFNYTQATLDMYKMMGAASQKPFNISGILYSDGSNQDIDLADENKIKTMTSEVLMGAKKVSDISIKDTLSKKKRKEYETVDLDKISEGYKSNTTGTPGNTAKPASRRVGRFTRKQSQQGDAFMGPDDLFDNNGQQSDGFSGNQPYNNNAGYEYEQPYDQNTAGFDFNQGFINQATQGNQGGQWNPVNPDNQGYAEQPCDSDDDLIDF